MLSSLFSTCLLTLLSFFGGGEDTLRHLSPVEVSAQRVDQQMATHQLWRIEQREWQRQGTVHLVDALRTLPGVQLRDYGGAGALMSLSSRGLAAAHTVVTVDGFPVGEMANGVVDLSRFRLSDVGQMQWTVADAPALLTSVRSLGAAHLALSTADLVPHIGVEWGSFGQMAVDAAAHRTQGAHTLGAEGSFARADNDFPYRVVNGNSYDYGRRQQSPWQRWQGAAFGVGKQQRSAPKCVWCINNRRRNCPEPWCTTPRAMEKICRPRSPRFNSRTVDETKVALGSGQGNMPHNT